MPEAPLADTAAEAAAVFAGATNAGGFAGMLDDIDARNNNNALSGFDATADAQLKPAENSSSLKTTDNPSLQKLDAELARSRKYKTVPKLAIPAPSLVPKFEKYLKVGVLLFLVAILAFLVFGRSFVSRKLPFMMDLYHAMGMAPFPVGSGLMFANVVDTSDFSEVNQLVIKGDIKNTTPYPLDVPLINLTITAETGQRKNFLTRPPLARLEGNQSVPFTLLRRGFAKKNWKVMLSFGDTGEKTTPTNNAGERK